MPRDRRRQKQSASLDASAGGPKQMIQVSKMNTTAATPVTDAAGPTANVRRQWNDYRIATYRFADVDWMALGLRSRGRQRRISSHPNRGAVARSSSAARTRSCRVIVRGTLVLVSAMNAEFVAQFPQRLADPQPLVAQRFRDRPDMGCVPGQ